MIRQRFLVMAAILAAAIVVPLVCFFARPPVLVVADASFVVLYGDSFLRRQQRRASLGLFRQVKPVKTADGAGPDMVTFAIMEVSSRPLCVLFSRDQSPAAGYFHEQFPEIPAVLLGGTASASGLPSPDGVLCVYHTDRETDLYRAGLFAGILGAERQKTEQQAENQSEITDSAPKNYILWHDRYVRPADREFFLRGIREKDPEASVIFVRNAAEMPDAKGISCLTLAGAGAEYLEKNPKMPIILFSWLAPSMTAQEALIQFDDSVWALAVPAVRMAVQNQGEGKIPSMPLISSRKIANNNLLRILKKSAEKMP